MIIRLFVLFSIDLVEVVTFYLLTDAKICKDVVEDILGGDFADDAAEVVGCLAEILGKKVGRKVCVQRGKDSFYGALGISQRLVMAQVSYVGFALNIRAETLADF